MTARPATAAVPYRAGELRFAAIAGASGAVWLDSGDADHGAGRYDIISCQPRRRAQFEWAPPDRRAPARGSPAACPFSLMQAWRGPAAPGELPFRGGVIGVLGYELNRSLEHIPPPRTSATPFPIAWLGHYPWALVQDASEREAWLVAEDTAALQAGRRWLAHMDGAPAPLPPLTLDGPWLCSGDEAGYSADVARIGDYIRAGDCYQVNLARHFSAPYTGHPWHAYRQLRRALSAPFSAFVNTGAGYLLSLSPERLLSVDGGQVLTSPIKGTRPRDPDPARDRALAAELLGSLKDRAENLMIVDLLRNDLGRSCRPGSIAVETLFALESYANVHHLVSTVRGELSPEVAPPEALRRAFPGGSVTGAPKIRAMEIINELEPVGRSAYCGSVFYYSNHGRLDSSITIRSLIADGQRLHCWGGGGIVADSDPGEELAETRSKTQLLLDTVAGLGP